MLKYLLLSQIQIQYLKLPWDAHRHTESPLWKAVYRSYSWARVAAPVDRRSPTPFPLLYSFFLLFLSLSLFHDHSIATPGRGGHHQHKPLIQLINRRCLSLGLSASVDVAVATPFKAFFSSLCRLVYLSLFISFNEHAAQLSWPSEIPLCLCAGRGRGRQTEEGGGGVVLSSFY